MDTNIQVAPIVERLLAEEGGLTLEKRKHRARCFRGVGLLDWCALNLIGWSQTGINSFIGLLLNTGVIIDVADGNERNFKSRHYYYFAESSMSIVASPKTNRKKVVILGGGFAGSFSALTLEQYSRIFDVTLIDNKEFFENTPQILRLVTEPGINDSVESFKKLVIPHHKYLSHATVVKANVKEVTKDSRVITDIGTFSFDYLLVATGACYKSPILHAGSVDPIEMVQTFRLKALASAALDIERANDITIVGGGMVGLELLGEIVAKYPTKNLTVIHSHDRVVERMDKSVSKKAQKWFDGENVKFILSDTAESISSKKDEQGHPRYTLTLKSGTQVESDLVCWCTGQTANTTFLERNFGSLLDEHKRVRTNEFFQLEGFPNIFALGDVTAFQEEKRVERATVHAGLVVEHLRKFAKGSPLEKPYKALKRPATLLISLGPKNSILAVNGKFVADGKLASKAKNTFFQSVMTNLSSKRGHAQIHDRDHVAFSLVTPHQITHTITIFGAEKRANYMVRLLSSFKRQGIEQLVAALPKDQMIKSYKKTDRHYHSATVENKNYDIKFFDPARPTTLAPILKSSGVFVVYIDAPFDQDSTFFEVLAAAAAETVSDSTLLLVYPYMTLFLREQHKEIAQKFQQILDIAKKSFYRVIQLTFGGNYDWLLIMNPTLSSTKLLYYPFGKKAMQWTTSEDIIEAIGTIASFPDKFHNERYYFMGSEPLTSEALSTALRDVAQSDVSVVIPEPEEIISMMEETIGSLARIIYDSVSHSKPSSNNDAELILRRPTAPISEWVSRNANLFL